MRSWWKRIERRRLVGSRFRYGDIQPRGVWTHFTTDLEIPIKYGIRQPVSMTVGPPGISAAIRTAPVAHEIVEDMEEVCPGAYLLNVTNPMSAVTRAMNMASKSVQVIGMCHEFHAFRKYLEPILGLEKPDGMNVVEYLYEWLPDQGFEYTVAGLNHFIWITRATRNGEDIDPKNPRLHHPEPGHEARRCALRCHHQLQCRQSSLSAERSAAFQFQAIGIWWSFGRVSVIFEMATP